MTTETTTAETPAGKAPCPWCGTTNIPIIQDGDNFTAYCPFCYATGPGSTTVAEAVAAWDNQKREDIFGVLDGFIFLTDQTTNRTKTLLGMAADQFDSLPLSEESKFMFSRVRNLLTEARLQTETGREHLVGFIELLEKNFRIEER